VAFKTKKILEWIIFSLFALVLLASILLLFYQQTYADKIYRGVSVANLNLSGQTKEQAQALLENKMTNILEKDLILTAGDQKITTKVSNTGFDLDVNETVSNAYAVGRAGSFTKQVVASAKTLVKNSPVTLTTKINSNEFNAFVSSEIPSMGVAPKNASINITNGVISLVPEQYGQTIDSSDLTDKIMALSNQDDTAQSFVVNLTVSKVAPKILTADLSTAESEASGYLDKNINLVYSGKTYTPSKTDIGKWITFTPEDNGYTVGLNDAAIKSYLSTIAKNFEVTEVDQKISAVDNSVINPGVQGVTLNEDQALSDIKTQMASASPAQITLTTTTEAPKVDKVFPAEGTVAGRFTGNYIDVDLTTQQLCQINSDTIIACYPISSGKGSTPTPLGTRYVEDKSPDKWSYPYGLWMPWWNGIGEGYGIHELPVWPSGYQEGADHLGDPVSDGCIRLGVGPAETIYDWAAIGTPVYIHN
jgi:vancomycin resistance protein YoaR